MPLNEAEVSQRIRKALVEAFPGIVVFKHNDHVTGGVPDFSVTWSGRTIWIEVKYITRGLISNGLQRRTMERLSRHGHAYYVIYDATMDVTYIVSPAWVDFYCREAIDHELGLAPQLVVRFIRSYNDNH